MSDLKFLESSITSLLSRHECVVIPEMGAFLLRHAAAAANPFNGEIRPAGQTLFFNPGITSDDGLLASAWREHFGTDYAGASAMLSECRQQILDQIKDHRSCSLGSLGNFFMNNEGRLLFVPLSGVNLDRKSFGLRPVTIDTADNRSAEAAAAPAVKYTPAEKAPVQEKTVEMEEAEILHMEAVVHSGGRSLIWKVAATVCLVSLTAVAVIYGKHMLRARRDVNTAGSVQAPAESEKIKAETRKTAQTVYQQPIKDINAENEALKSAKGDVLITGGAYMNKDLALNECRQWNRLGVPAVIGRKKGSSLVKVVLGRFNTEEAASEALEALPGNPGFYAGILISPIETEK